MHVRRDLLLIFKEAVNNAARHSGCSRVEIDLRVEGTRLALTIADNGAGFDTSLESEGQGLMSMRRRAQRLGGTLEVTSGTRRGYQRHARPAALSRIRSTGRSRSSREYVAASKVDFRYSG